MHIQITRSNTNRKFEDCDYYEFDNVSSVTYFNCENRASLHIGDDAGITLPHYKYFICDAPGSPAFGHWIHEFFYPSLPLLFHFRKDEDILFVFMDEPKRYMINFLLRIGIPNDRMVWASSQKNTHVKINGIKSISLIHQNNTTIIPPLYSLNIRDHEITPEDWERQIFHSTLLSLPEPSNQYPFVLIKRSIKENFMNRVIQNGYDRLEDWVIKAGGILFDAYLINNIHLQETIIRNARVIITNSGSSYLVNGVIAKDSVIVVIDEINVHRYLHEYPGVKAINDFIIKYNTIHVTSDVDSTIHMLTNL